jgi:hypothetical protein
MTEAMVTVARETIEKLLAAIRSGELSASPSEVAALRGALEALLSIAAVQ